jgi:hypothetical protein
MEPHQIFQNYHELSGREMANALVALGVLGDSSNPGNETVSFDSDITGKDRSTEMAVSRLEKIVTLLKVENNSIPKLYWAFPMPNMQLKFGEISISVGDIDLQELAGLWQKLASNLTMADREPTLRLVISEIPVNMDARPWLKMLSECDPSDTVIHFGIKTQHPEIYMQWPLRFGFIKGNSAGYPLSEAHGRWPSNVNAKLLPMGREHDNCDILCFDGSFNELRSVLRRLPARLKCNLIIIRYPHHKSLTAYLKNLKKLAWLTRANGFLFLKSSISDEDYAHYLNFLVEALSHDLPFDHAISMANRYFYPELADSLLFINENLARFRLDQMIDQLIHKMDDMPMSASIDIADETMQKLSLDKGGFQESVAEFKTMLEESKDKISYRSESIGATGITEINEALQKAEMNPEVLAPRSNRFISARSFVRSHRRFVEEKRALLVNKPARFLFRVGPPDKAWAQHSTPVPEEKLPEQKEAWRLKVVLSDPVHLVKPLVRYIRLPKDGPSSECAFVFTPHEAIPFEGRITLLHRGRIIQTAVMKIPVVETAGEILPDYQLAVSDIIPVRANLGNLDERRQFDLAFITNHTTEERPLLTAISDEHAWLVNLDACAAITREINLALSDVARSVADYTQGFESKEGEELLMKLVFSGCELYSAIVEEELMRPSNRAGMAHKEYLQIVSTKNDSVIPFEFIYDKDVPDDDALLCPNWKEALCEGSCLADCSKNFRKTVCPLGFWGLSKVIERHDVTPELSVGNASHFLQSQEAEVFADRAVLNLTGPGLFAVSRRVKKQDTESINDTFSKALQLPPIYAGSWADWEKLVSGHRPNLIVALPHTDGTGSGATLEIGNNTIRSIQVRNSHVRPEETGHYPVVALLGCDTSGSAIEYARYIRQFRLKGASLVIGTIATVFGEHAARVANMLIAGLTSQRQDTERIGEVMRQIKRRAVANGLVMALCLVAFGDADWKLK